MSLKNEYPDRLILNTPTSPVHQMEMLMLLNMETVNVAWGPHKVGSLYSTAIGSNYTRVEIFMYADNIFT
jgi:hypothetical protein